MQAQLLGLHGEILHTGVCGDHDACTHQNLQGAKDRLERTQPDIRRWIEHVEVDRTVGAERLRVSSDGIEGGIRQLALKAISQAALARRDAVSLCIELS
ncbi:hypothetical protein ABT294_40050 [Nonomuraea sp. NPDC000554]|uniref:hypothetical protein n=1 Tax=Nonomuraea sp. NPDC000554 TaxID=3154259 RepID=UPI0033279440